MAILFTSEFQQKLKEIKRYRPKLFQKIEKQLFTFSQNSHHPSLRTHKLRGDLNNAWSISITSDYRALYYVSEENYVFFALGTHDEVYRN